MAARVYRSTLVKPMRPLTFNVLSRITAAATAPCIPTLNNSASWSFLQPKKGYKKCMGQIYLSVCAQNLLSNAPNVAAFWTPYLWCKY